MDTVHSGEFDPTRDDPTPHDDSDDTELDRSVKRRRRIADEAFAHIPGLDPPILETVTKLKPALDDEGRPIMIDRVLLSRLGKKLIGEFVKRLDTPDLTSHMVREFKIADEITDHRANPHFINLLKDPRSREGLDRPELTRLFHSNPVIHTIRDLFITAGHDGATDAQGFYARMDLVMRNVIRAETLYDAYRQDDPVWRRRAEALTYINLGERVMHHPMRMRPLTHFKPQRPGQQ